MALTQQTFLGSSIRNFTCSLGWKNEISRLTVNLVDDLTNGDLFTPPLPGAPCYFQYDNFEFGGLLQSYKTVNTVDGYPVYEVILIDPRELLEGVQLILNDYNGDTTGIPNLYNVYGYWENNNFGSSLVNDSGMPWERVIEGFNNLNVLYPVQFKNYAFRVNLTALPILPSYYRVGGGFSISLMEVITKICEDGGQDFFFTLVNVGGFAYITLVTASRIGVPELGKISTFIAQNTSNQAVSSEYGLEMRNETNSKFIVGGNIARVYVQTPANGDATTYVDDTISQFWGVNEDGTPVLGFPDDNDYPPSSGQYNFYVPSRFVNVYGVEDYYPTNVMEMRAALGGQSSWETYLWSENNVENSPHEFKASRIGIISNLREDIKGILARDFTDEAKFRGLDLKNLAPLTGKLLNRKGDFLTEKEENIKILYDYVNNFASENYGKRFMVRIPFTYAALESETNTVRTSMQPCEGGYLSDTEVANAVNNGYLPSNIFNLTKEDGRIVAYARFYNAQNLDLSDIPPDSIAMDFKQVRNRNSETGYDDVLIAYVKCEVEDKIYYLNNTTLFSPRVVINLPGKVTPKDAEGDSFAGVLKDIFTEHIRGVIGITNRATIKDMISTVFNRFGGEQLLYGMAGLAVTPDLVGIPLQSNIETYGPWYSLGAIGKIETVKEPTLVPWNYGGYEALDLIGNAMVSEGVTYQQVGETGSIEVPGSPQQNLGSQLLSGGPYITNISVSIGENGVTTSYRMETWTPRFGRLAKSYIDRVTKMSSVLQSQKRLVQQLSLAPPPGSKFFSNRGNALLTKTPRRSAHTSAGYLAGDIFTNISGTKSSNVVICPTYDLTLTVNSGNYLNKGFMSLDGMFRPFSTDTSVSGIAHFEVPLTSGTGNINVDDLNPFKVGNDINTYAVGSELPDDGDFLNDDANTKLRAIALRGPLVVSGWGYDTSGKPVPNENEDNPTDNFKSDYLFKSDEWKTGPVDLHWDRNRKVWATGGGDFRVAKLTQNLIGGGWASGVFLTPVISGAPSYLMTGWTEESGGIRIYDGFEYSYPSTPSGARVYIQKEQSSQEWFVFAAGVI